jgi:transposase
MARRPISMNKQTEIQRLKALGLKERAIARSLKVSRKTVHKYLQDTPGQRPPETSVNFTWEEIIKEHQLSDVPLLVLWEELKESGKTTWSYSYFWKQYQKHCPSEREATMIRHHVPGEKAEIDYCDGIDILDLATGEITKTHLFVGVLCRSRYTYAEFSFTQKSSDFLNSHVRMFNFFGGVPRQIAPDNLKSAVSKAHKYDPDINPAYQ